MAGLAKDTIDSPQTTSYPEHLTGAFTGGFSEETCRKCHFDYDLNPDGGSLTLRSLQLRNSKNNYRELIITVRRPDLGASGFQLTARYPDGSQAGKFIINNNTRLQQTKQVPDSVIYIQHSAAGSEPIYTDSTLWKVTWKPPDNPIDTVFFHVATNAANGDQSEFGDWIYTQQKILPL